MLTALKDILKAALVPLLYLSGYVVMLLSIFKEARWGLLLLIFLIPQPNIWYKFHAFPLGKDFLDLLSFSVFAGILLQKKGFCKNGNSWFIAIFLLYTYCALWNTSISFNMPAPVSKANFLLYDFKNYAMMIFLYYLTVNVLQEEDQHKVAITLITLVILFIAVRSYRNFTAGSLFDYDKRVDGPFWAVGLGSNHCGAFFAHYGSVLLGLFLLDKHKIRKSLYLAAIWFGVYPLLFSYSRGAYLAVMGALTFLGITKKRVLLIPVIILLLTWNTILPESVIDRINMTESSSGELDGSAAQRLDLWQLALDLFEKNPVVGIGYGGFGLSIPDDFKLGLTDTHSFYIKTLCEQGAIGIGLLLLLFFLSFRSGWLLYNIGISPFYKGLGLGFMGCVLASMITNAFGDRFSYFELGGYFWICWGIVDRAIIESTKLKYKTA